MRVTWLNTEMTEAIVERGRLWWRKRAMIRMVEEKPGEYDVWRFVSGDDCPLPVVVALNGSRVRRMKAHADKTNWQPVRSLPPAKVVGK